MVWYKKEGDKFFDANEEGRAKSEEDKRYEVNINLRPAMIRYEIEESLRRLKTDRIDLYQTHWQDSTTKTEDVMAELMKLKQEGKIRAIGCSNATIEQMKRYQAVGQLDTDQEQYSMLQRQHEGDNLPFCRDNSIAFLAYSPMVLGILSGKIGPDHEFGEGDVRRGNRPKVDALLLVIRSVAEEKGITIAQTVIAWTLEQPGCSHALVGSQSRPGNRQRESRRG
jgi:aryl-alcohol dehydrogenase-like predicted oxidoreductase